ncbi:MAG: DMT family transporter [Lachnospiraceae bacterium]|nr:DMT family transporter [Lachnospiraceae bacterium]
MEKEKEHGKMEKKQTTGHLLAALTILVWGTTYISTKVLLRYFQPVEILIFRFIIGFLFLILLNPKPLKVERKHEIYFIMAGLTGITGYYLLENVALVYTQATNVGVIIAVAPFLTAILSHFFLKTEKLHFYFIMGFVLAIIGICMISFNGSSVFHLNPMGDLLAILAAVVWAIYSIVIKKVSEFGYGSIQTTRRTFLYGILFMIPAMFFMDYHPDYTQFLHMEVMGNILFLGFGASALCFVTWNVAVKRLGAVKTSIYIYMTPVITTVTSVIVLHEKINLISVLGIICTMAGLFLSGKKTVGQKAAHIM